MMTRNKLHLFIAGFVGVSVLVASVLLWVSHLGRMDVQQAKPYVTYSKLLYAADNCGRYKEQYATCPTNLAQLAEGLPEFGDPLDKDAWGRQIVLNPYSPEL